IQSRGSLSFQLVVFFLPKNAFSLIRQFPSHLRPVAFQSLPRCKPWLPPSPSRRLLRFLCSLLGRLPLPPSAIINLTQRSSSLERQRESRVCAGSVLAVSCPRRN
ncbi:unnamed protein product, partial [Ectocarpus sp. 12 AP-2014]